MRSFSKSIFASQYRAEVAEAILKLDDGWTTRDLEAKLAESSPLPSSCVTKELKVLLELGLIRRSRDKTVDGRFPYAIAPEVAPFWDFIRWIVGVSRKSGVLTRFPTDVVQQR